MTDTVPITLNVAKLASKMLAPVCGLRKRPNFRKVCSKVSADRRRSIEATPVDFAELQMSALVRPPPRTGPLQNHPKQSSDWAAGIRAGGKIPQWGGRTARLRRS